MSRFTASETLGVSLARRGVRSIRRKWKQYRWMVVGAAAAAAVVLGMVGYGQKQGGHWSYADRLYASVQLFSLTITGTPPYPAGVEVARWLAPLTVAYASYRAIGALFSEQWNQLRVRFFARNHIVVCGLGACGLRLAIAFHEAGVPVVVVDRNPSEAGAEECRVRAIPVLVGDATDSFVLGRTSLGRAHYLVAVCGDDGINSEVAILARALAGRREQALRCFVQVADDRLCQLLEQVALADPSHELVRFEFFNIYQAGPSALLDAHGGSLSQTTGTAPHLIVVGKGRVGLGVVVEAARRWSVNLELRDRPDRIRITVVFPDAGEWCDALRLRHPALDKVCDLVACAADASDVDMPLPLPLESASDDPDTMVFVCFDDDAAGLRATIQLRHVLRDDVPIVVCTTEHVGVASLLSRSQSYRLANVSSFELLERVCRPEVLLNSLTETLAQAIHADYVHRRRAQGAPASDPAMVPWEALPETLRESNRDQAADIGRKLDAVGYELTAAPEWSPPSLSFTADEVELLAKLEHDRWHRDRIRDGWRFGPERDPELKRSPYLIPWESLTEEVRDLDRDAVRALPVFLARAGFGLGHRTSQPKGGA